MKPELTLDDLTPMQLRNFVEYLRCECERLSSLLQVVLDEERTFRAEVEALARRAIHGDIRAAGNLALPVLEALKRLKELKEPPRQRLIDVGGDDGFTMQLSAPPWALRAFGESLAETIGAAKNYTETCFAFPTHNLALTIVRVDGKTPHEMRMEAERERDEMRAEVARLRGEPVPTPTPTPSAKKPRPRKIRFVIDGKTKVLRCNRCGGSDPLQLPTDDVGIQDKAFRRKHRGCKAGEAR